MRKITFKSIFLSLALASGLSVSAQKIEAGAIDQTRLTPQNQQHYDETGVVRCYTVEKEMELQQRFPNRATDAQFEAWLAPKIEEVRQRQALGQRMAVTTIPVIFHIVADAGTQNDLSAAVIQNQLDQLNLDFSNMSGSSQGAAADTELQFCLAAKDPMGVNLVEPGINRVRTYGDGPFTDTFIDGTVKVNNSWNPDDYMNIWVANISGGLLGWAQFPSSSGLAGMPANGGAANTDGVVVLSSSVGSIANPNPNGGQYNAGRTLTHEVGHWVGLRHLWGDGDCTADDFCADTPNCDGPYYGAGPAPTQCGNVRQIENYMDYSDDAAMNTYTADQKTRIVAVMTNSPRRNTLGASTACVPSTDPNFLLQNTTGALTNCGADSVMYTVSFTTQNGYSDNTTFSATGNPAGSVVSFSPTSISADGNVTVTISNLGAVTDGAYTVTVTGTGSVTRDVDLALTVGSGVCTVAPTTPWATSVTQVQFNTINSSSSTTGADGGTGYTDFTAQSTDVNRESSYDLTVNVNTDGNYRVQAKAWVDWNQNCVFDANEEYDLAEAANVANGPTAASPFSISVPSDAVLGTTIMRIAAMYTAPDPISYPEACADNPDAETEDYTINVLPSLSVGSSDFTRFDVFPNPTNGNVNLIISTNEKVEVSLFDIRGRQVFENSYDNNSTVFNKTINLEGVSSGMYILTVNSGSKKATRKIVIE